MTFLYGTPVIFVNGIGFMIAQSGIYMFPTLGGYVYPLPLSTTERVYKY